MESREIFLVITLIFIGLVVLIAITTLTNPSESISNTQVSSGVKNIGTSEVVSLKGEENIDINGVNKGFIDRRVELDKNGCYESLYQEKRCPETKEIEQLRYNCERTIKGGCNPQAVADRRCYESVPQVKTCPDTKELEQQHYNCERTIKGGCNPQAVADRECYKPLTQVETCPDSKPVEQFKKDCEKERPGSCY